MKFQKTLLFLLIAFMIMNGTVSAQRQRNYVYVFDCTKSMKDFKIWDAAKKWLNDDISRQADDATITLIPFRDNPDMLLKFTKKDYNWSDVEAKLDSLIGSRHSQTGICRAWDKGFKELKEEKDNYFYLLTDGEDGYNGKAALLSKLQNWCKMNKKDYGFYVTLSDDAKLVLKDLNIDCDRFFTIDGSKHIPPIGVFCPDEFTVNLREIKDKELAFSTFGEFPVQVSCDDPNFKVEVIDGCVNEGRAKFKITPLRDNKELIEELPELYNFECRVMPKNKDELLIPNNFISIHVSNKPVRNLDLIKEEQAGEASWYDSCLFSDAKEHDTIRIALANTWNALAKKHGSRIRIHVSCETLKPTDYKLLLNGKEVGSDAFELTADSENDELGVVFAETVEDDTYFFKLTSSERDCDKLETLNDEEINGTPYENTLRLSYDVCWNPLKTFLFWLAIVVLALLVLWFLFVRPMFIDTFKVGSIMVTDPYFQSIRIHRARKLVFTSKQKKDNILARLFLGKTIYSVNAVWRNELVMIPGMKKGIKVITKGKYTVDPYASTLMKGNDYTIIDNETNDQVKITV